MPRYAIHFVDHGENVFGTADIVCVHDDEAIAQAQRMDVPSIGNGFDLWHEDRLVHRHRHSGKGA